MTGATPAEATRALRDALQRVASCVTPQVLVGQHYTAESELLLVSRLAAMSGGGLTLSLRHLYAIVGNASRVRSERWQAQTTGYYYKLDDADGREIIAYHWHPTGRSPMARPHMHLGAGAGVLRTELQKAHLGTGFVTPAVLLRLLLESFAVRPRRADWGAILAAADRALAPP